jgi:hypothetical protein
MADDGFFGTVRPPAVFNKRSPLNTYLGGKITKIEGLDGKLFATKFRADTTAPIEVKRWPSPGKDAEGKEIPGEPIPQIIITVQTNLRDPDNPADSGERCFYLEKKSLTRKNGNGREPAFDTDYGSFIKALEDAGTPKNPQVGGELYQAKIGTAPGFGGNDRNLWAAKYTPPTGPTGVFDEVPTINHGVSDPKSTQRAALKLEITDAANENVLRALWTRASNAGVLDDEIKSLITGRREQLNAPVTVPDDCPF